MYERKPCSQSWYRGENLQIGLRNAIRAVFFLSGVDLFIFLHLNPAIYKIGNAPIILCSRCKEQDESHSPFYLLLLDFKIFSTTQSLSHNGNFISIAWWYPFKSSTHVLVKLMIKLMKSPIWNKILSLDSISSKILLLN